MVRALHERKDPMTRSYYNQQKNITKESLQGIRRFKIEGQWSKTLVLQDKIIDLIDDWVNKSGKDFALQAKKEGWFSITGKTSLASKTVPDKPCESLIGYLNAVLARQFFLLYQVRAKINSEFEFKEVLEWLISKEFKDKVYSSGEVEVIYKPEHFELIRKRYGVGKK